MAKKRVSTFSKEFFFHSSTFLSSVDLWEEDDIFLFFTSLLSTVGPSFIIPWVPKWYESELVEPPLQMISLPHFAQVAQFPSLEKWFHTQDDILVTNTQQERQKSGNFLVHFRGRLIGYCDSINQPVNREIFLRKWRKSIQKSKRIFHKDRV